MNEEPIDDVDLDDVVGSPGSEAPKVDPGSNCYSRQTKRVHEIVDDEIDTKIEADRVDDELLERWATGDGEEYGDDDTKVFVGYCQRPAGTGTDHPGEGRCKHHGGNAASGRDHGSFKHGLFSDVMNDEDRAVMAELEGVSNADQLDELIRLNMAQLRRAVSYMVDDEEQERTFFDAFDEIVTGARADGEPGLDKGQIRELANLLGSGQKAMQDKMDLVRRLVLAHSKITEGEKLNVDQSTEISGDASFAVEWQGVDDPNTADSADGADS